MIDRKIQLNSLLKAVAAILPVVEIGLGGCA
jgi:hypothetical protein